jgi:hypothetical protein
MSEETSTLLLLKLLEQSITEKRRLLEHQLPEKHAQFLEITIKEQYKTIKELKAKLKQSNDTSLDPDNLMLLLKLLEQSITEKRRLLEHQLPEKHAQFLQITIKKQYKTIKELKAKLKLLRPTTSKQAT